MWKSGNVQTCAIRDLGILDLQMSKSERVNDEPAGFDGEVQHARAGFVQGLADCRDVAGVAEAEQAAAAAGAAHLAAEGASLLGGVEHHVDLARRDAGRELLA